MLAIQSCDICGGGMHARAGWIHRCRDCGFEVSSLSPGAGGVVRGIEALRHRNFAVLLERLEILRPLEGARLLEVGSAQGWFLDAALARGAAARGIEPEFSAAEGCRARGLRVDGGYFPHDLTDRGPFDFIIFNDVFEHLPGPSDMIRRVEALLAPGGLAVVNFPSSDGLLFRIAGLLQRMGYDQMIARLWQRDFPSPHLSYFSAANLALLAERHSGLKPVTSFPLVSMIREGLRERVRMSHGGLTGFCLFTGLWVLSFVIALFPSDIGVVVLRKDDALLRS